MPPTHTGDISNFGFRTFRPPHPVTFKLSGTSDGTSEFRIPNSEFKRLNVDTESVACELLRVLQVFRRVLAVDHVPLDPVFFTQGIEALPQVAV